MKLPRRIWNSVINRGKTYIANAKVKLLGISRYINVNKSGINLIGYFSYTSGVAEVGRLFSRFMLTAKIPFLLYDIHAPGYNKLSAVSLQSYLPYISANTVYHRNIFFINADQIPTIKHTFPKLFIGRYNAAVFFWEFNDYFYFPDALKALDEVIAFTEFIAVAVRKSAPASIRVTKLPLPFTKNWEITRSAASVRQQLRIAEDEFVFIFNFDFHSVYQRKNPEAILKAFEQAFVFTDNVRLILKTIHAETASDNNNNFGNAIASMQLKSKVILMNDNLERNEFMSIINASDCYISLHRSEGLGLGMLEAMSMGKPVIGTNYGGNTDFMRDDNSLLVNYTLVPVKEGAGPYKADWLWADADIQEASGYMAKLYNDQTYAKHLGQLAQQSIRKQYSNDVFKNSLDNWMQA